MVIQLLRFAGALCASNLVLFTLVIAVGDAADGPNQLTHSDFAAGRLVDSFFDPELPDPSYRKASQQNTRRRTQQRRAALRGKLVDNPNMSDGLPPFALVNRQGQVLRYVEPVDDINLDAYLGETVAVRRDTGRVLLATQLALPAGSSKDEAKLSAFQEPTPVAEPEPIPANEVAEEVAEGVAEEATGENSVMMPEPDQGPTFYDEGYDEGYGGEVDLGGCTECGSGTCQGCGKCGFGARGVMYAHAEYLSWWFQGMDTPRLVIQSPNANFTPFETIYGGSPILEDQRNGGRITFGLWLDDYGQWAIEGDYLAFGELDEVFRAGGNDGAAGPSDQYVGRPFFNTVDFLNTLGGNVPAGSAVQEVDTQRLDGFVTVTSRSEFRSAGIRLRHGLCCAEGCEADCGSTVSCGSGCGAGVQFGGPFGRLFRMMKYGTRRTDVIYGIRWANLEESLGIREDLQVVVAPALGDIIVVNDLFATSNDFFGGEVGFMMEWERNRWSLGVLSKVAIGNTRQSVTISGSTDVNGTTVPVATPGDGGGLLTQRYTHAGADGMAGTADDFVVGNIGTYERDEFSMIPELGATLGYNVTPRLKLTVGYTMLYWSNIVRPGEQIDLDVNGNLIPSSGVVAANVVNGDHPRFMFRQTDLWAHGINLGGEYRW